MDCRWAPASAHASFLLSRGKKAQTFLDAKDEAGTRASRIMLTRRLGENGKNESTKLRKNARLDAVRQCVIRSKLNVSP